MSELISLNLSYSPTVEQRDGSLENPAVPLTFPVELLQDGLWGPQTDAGVRVNTLIAMQNPTFFACVKVIAESMAQMPCQVFQNLGDKGVRLATEHPVFDLLHDRPNPYMSAPDFREALQSCLLGWGNAYAVIEYDGAGDPVALWPRNPAKTFPMIVNVNTPQEKLIYASTDGRENGQVDFYDSAEMIHLKALNFDGLVGVNPVTFFMKSALGLAIAAEQFGSRFYANNARPGGILIFKGNLNPADREQIRKAWVEAQAGYNQNRPAVLTGDWSWQDTNVAPEAAQFLATRKLQQQQIAGMFRVPAHMIGDLERSTNNNIEHQSLEFVRNCLGPWIAKWQSEFSYKLLMLGVPQIGRNAGKKYFVKFDTSELVMGDFKTTMDALNVGVGSGIFNRNEARKRLHMNPMGDEGDIFTVQNQNVNLETLTEPEEPSPVPGASPEKVPPTQKPSDEETPGESDQESDIEENSSQNVKAAQESAFTDAFNRYLVREKRSFNDVSKLFEPVLFDISKTFSDVAAAEIRVSPLPESEVKAIVRDHIEAMSKRSAKWTNDSADSELDRAIRSMRIAIYRESAIKKAKEQQ